MVLQHNLTAMFTNKQLGITTKEQAKSAEKLSTGYRINRAADDAAGLQISENMRRQVRGLNKASKNAEDGISYCQVSDGAMGEIDNIIHRVKELCIQGGNDTNTDADREAIQREIDALADEIGNITDNTEFNTLNVFGRNREVTITRPDGTKETMVQEVTGNSYGLGEVLTAGFVSSGSRMDEMRTISAATWEVTGSTAPGTFKYKNDRTAELENMLKKFNSNYNLDYNNAKAIPGAQVNGNTISIGYPLNQTPAPATIILSYGETKGLFNKPGYVLTQASYKDNTTGEVTNYGSIAPQKGAAPLFEKEYNCSWMDFKEANGTPGFQVSDLYNQGFCVGTAGDSGYYSVMFTNDPSDRPSTYIDGQSKLLKIDISDLSATSAPTAGQEIAKRIMEQAKNQLDSGYAQFAYNSASPDEAKIYVLDNRGSDSSKGTLELISRGPNGEQVSSDTVTRTEVNANGEKTIYSYEDKDLWIQSGDLELSGIMVKKEWLTRANIGLDLVSVADFDSASAGIVICDRALEKVSSARSNMGAYMNRMEYAVAVDNNTSENVQSSESRLRDTDMADEMVQYSRSNILAQAGQSMLAQANQSTQGILSLLQ